MTKNLKIHIFGASGSGVTTLGKNLSHYLGIPFFDADDFYWKKTNPPFQEANAIELRKSLINEALSGLQSWIVSGSLVAWSDEIQNEFNLAIYLYVPKEERSRRIKVRENTRFGSRVAPGGDMFEGHIKFIEWAMQYDEGFLGGRSKPRHKAWMETLKCPVIKIEDTLNEKDLHETVVAQINSLLSK